MSEKEGISGNKKIQSALRKLQKVEAEQVRADLRWIMSDPRGRRWLYALIFDKCRVMSKIWTPSAEIHLSEGKRQVGIEVLEEAQGNEDLYLEMLQEVMNEAKARKLRIAQMTENTDG